ncbi:putative o-spanin [Pseudomonas phage Eisa9]|uniref:O-spanin n=1 Tax=Pseudomonas phage Eisa9 TaxID=2900148 RepID=A0AAE8YKK4_9CAUD|nr:putative o-spanin [Pseudomonas phage Eisa9]
MRSLKNLITGILLCLLALLTGCVSASAVPSNPYVPCVHPIVSTATTGGLVQGLLDYADAVDTCNVLNGHVAVEPKS